MTTTDKLLIATVVIVCLASCCAAAAITGEPLMGLMVFMGYVILIQKTLYEKEIDKLRAKVKKMKGN